VNGHRAPSTLRRARLNQGYVLSDIERQTGYAHNHLSELERGKNTISVDRLADVAGALRLTDEELGRAVREIAQANLARKAGQPAV